MIVDTNEAARMVGVTAATIRQWVVRGWLSPVRRGARPLKFAAWDVWRCAAQRMPETWHTTVDHAARRWADACNQSDQLLR